MDNRLSIEKIAQKQLLQRMLNSFSTATRLFVAVTDTNGEFLLSSKKGDCDFCRQIKSIPMGLERCQGSYARAGKQAERWKEPYFFRCHAGLIAWACPIMAGGNHLGNMICGQVLMWEPEDLLWREIRESIRDLVPDESGLIKAARRLEVISANQAQAAADLLFIMANDLAVSGTDVLKNQQQLRMVSSWLWEQNQRHSQLKFDLLEDNDNIFELENRISWEIKQANKEAASKLLDELALKFFIKSKGQIGIIKGLSVEFISSLARLATECGIKFEDSFRFDLMNLQDLENADTVEKAFLWLLATGNSYINLLTENRCQEGDAVIQKAVSYIQKNYMSPEISLEEIAKACFVSPSYLSRVFKKKNGQSIIEFLRNVRIEQAKNLLRKLKTTSEVASLVGYNDRSYFCKVFKQVVGLSPNDYRRNVLLK